MSVTPLPKNQVRSRGKIDQHEHCDDADARRVKIVDEVGDAINSGNRLPVDAVVNIAPGAGVDEATIYNVSVVTANVEVSLALPADLAQLKLRIREPNRAAVIQYTFDAGQSGTTYYSVKPGNTEVISDISFSGETLYFQTTQSNVTVELIALHM